MIELRNHGHIVGQIVIICMACLGVYLLSLPTFAQSSDATVQPGASIPAHLTNIPTAYITGYVLDEDGKPVPHATVSLWQDGQLWSTKYLLSPSDNPQMSRIAYTNESGSLGSLKEGGFLFGFAYPGDYILTAEKDGYNGSSMGIHVGEDTISSSHLESIPHPVMVNITLKGYHVPTLTPSQRANTGGIIGSIGSQYGHGAGDVSLWRDGQLVRLPDNPQKSFVRDYAGKEVDYVFEHLPAGHYTVKVVYHAGPIDEEETFPVDVGTSIVTADITLTKMPPRPQLATYVPDPSQSTTNVPSPTQPTPALPGLITLLVIGFVLYYIANKK